MRRYLPIATIVALIGAAGVIQGQWRGRWGESELIAVAAARLAEIPKSIGEWSSEDIDVSPRELKNAGADGCLSRRYVNRRSGAVVSVFLLCGRPGPISVHTPDICYRGSGFEEVGESSRLRPNGENNAEFIVRRFRKDGAIPFVVQVLYGWSSTDVWEAPANPRLAFASRPVLYKLYIQRELSRELETTERDPAVDLFRAIRPQFRAAFVNGGSVDPARHG